MLIILGSLIASVRWGVEEGRKPKLVIESPFYARLDDHFGEATKFESNPDGTVVFSKTLYFIVQNVHKRPAENCRVEVRFGARILSGISRLPLIRPEGASELESDIRWKDNRKVNVFTLKGILSPSGAISYSVEYDAYRFASDHSTRDFASITKAIDSEGLVMDTPFKGFEEKPIHIDPSVQELVVFDCPMEVSLVADGGYHRSAEYNFLCFVASQARDIREKPHLAMTFFFFDKGSWR